VVTRHRALRSIGVGAARIGRSVHQPLSVGLSRLPGMRTSGLVSLLLGGGSYESTLAEPRVTIERDA